MSLLVGVYEVSGASDNRLPVAAGHLYTDGDFRFAVIRLGTNGDWDPNFASSGIATFFFGCNWAWGCVNGSIAQALAIDAQGRIVVGGYSGVNGPPPTPVLTRLTATGDVDPEFGFVSLPLAESWITDVTVSGSGKIWIAGQFEGWSPFVGRLTSGGNLDSVFGSGADPVEDDGTLTASCEWAVYGDPQVLERSFLKAVGPNTITLVRKAVLIAACWD